MKKSRLQKRMNMLAVATAKELYADGKIEDLRDWEEMERMLKFELCDQNRDLAMVYAAIAHVRRWLYTYEL